MASERARSAPTFAASAADALVCKRFNLLMMDRNSGERDSYAAVREVNAVSPPPEAGISRTQKNPTLGVLGVNVWSMCQSS